MNKATKLVAAMGVVGVFAATAVFANSAATLEKPEGVTFKPGQGISFDLGGKHAVGYFMTEGDACKLTVVLASVDGGATGDSPGTRVIASVVPGRPLQLDGAVGKSAEFHCGPGGAAMSTKILDRTQYKS